MKKWFVSAAGSALLVTLPATALANQGDFDAQGTIANLKQKYMEDAEPRMKKALKAYAKSRNSGASAPVTATTDITKLKANDGGVPSDPCVSLARKVQGGGLVEENLDGLKKYERSQAMQSQIWPVEDCLAYAHKQEILSADKRNWDAIKFKNALTAPMGAYAKAVNVKYAGLPASDRDKLSGAAGEDACYSAGRAVNVYEENLSVLQTTAARLAFGGSMSRFDDADYEAGMSAKDNIEYQGAQCLFDHLKPKPGG